MIVRSFKYRNGKNWIGAKNLSHPTNAARETTPITIITIISALPHFPAEDEARLKGRRTSENPAVIKRMPMTGYS